MPLFTPPTVERPMAPDDRLAYRPFNRLRMKVGQTVLKRTDGSYITISDGDPADVDAAAAIYFGGRAYEISDDEAASLEAAGYEVTYP